MQRQARLLVLGFVAMWLCQCTSSDFTSAGGSKAKSGGDGRRPSEQGEGVIGYLHDPESLIYQEQGENIVINGEPGAVVREGHSPEGLLLCLQEVSVQDLKGILASAAGYGGDQVVTLAQTKALADGSFELSVPKADVDRDKLLSIDASGLCAEGGPAQVEAGKNQVVFMSFAAAGRFNDVHAAESLPEPASDTVTDVQPAKPIDLGCDAVGEACNPPLRFAVTDAATGSQIDRFFVRVYDYESCGKPDVNGQRSCITLRQNHDFKGDQALQLPPGTYYITVFATDYAESEGRLYDGGTTKGEVWSVSLIKCAAASEGC